MISSFFPLPFSPLVSPFTPNNHHTVVHVHESFFPFAQIIKSKCWCHPFICSLPLSQNEYLSTAHRVLALLVPRITMVSKTQTIAMCLPYRVHGPLEDTGKSGGTDNEVRQVIKYSVSWEHVWGHHNKLNENWEGFLEETRKLRNRNKAGRG